ncbi:MAG TPA: hypothetical protein VE967_01570, partial [Gemmatimonadaceae bacterium]|nr:hypothetical protein [Gemmatimonadaceae bacterium]
MRVIAMLSLAVATSHVASAQAPRTSRTRSGDTTVIVTTGNGVWGPLHDAAEVKRINADTKESTFGQVSMLAATSDGGVALFDTKSLDGPIIRRFDAEGRFMNNLGRRGSGPGEYELGPMNM